MPTISWCAGPYTEDYLQLIEAVSARANQHAHIALLGEFCSLPSIRKHCLANFSSDTRIVACDQQLATPASTKTGYTMAAAVDRSRLDRLLNAEDPPDAAERGVTYEFLERLVRKQKLSSLSTRQVGYKCIIAPRSNCAD